MISQRSGRGRSFLWIAGITLVLLLLVIRFGRGPGGLERRLAAYRKAGIPTTDEELVLSAPQIPEAENEVYKLRNAMRTWKRLNPIPDREFQAVDTLIKANPAAVANFETELVANHASLELLHSITNPQQSRFELNRNRGFSLEYVPYYRFQNWLQEGSGVLRLECRVHRSRGNPEEAAKALVSGLRVARMLERTRSWVGQLDHLAILDGWLHELEWLLSGDALPAASLELLQRELERHDERLGLTFALQDIRVGTLDQFGKQWIESTGSKPSLVYNPNAMERVLIKLYVGSGIPSRDLLRALDLIDQFCGLAEKPTEAFQADEPQVIRAGGASGVLLRLVGHREIVTGEMLHQLWNRRLELVARLRCARAAVAVERWRVLHAGAIPKGLELLVPGVLSSLPLQPSGASPLLFSTRSTAYYIETPYGDSTRTPMVFSVQIPSPQPDAAARQ